MTTELTEEKKTLNRPKTDIPQLRENQDTMEQAAQAMVKSGIFNDMPKGNEVIFEICKVIVLNDPKARSYIRGVLTVSSQIKKRHRLVGLLRTILRHE